MSYGNGLVLIQACRIEGRQKFTLSMDSVTRADLESNINLLHAQLYLEQKKRRKNSAIGPIFPFTGKVTVSIDEKGRMRVDMYAYREAITLFARASSDQCRGVPLYVRHNLAGQYITLNEEIQPLVDAIADIKPLAGYTLTFARR